MLYYSRGVEKDDITKESLRIALPESFAQFSTPKKILIIPPDFTSYHSMTGEITRITWHHYRKAVSDNLPALGTHFALSGEEILYRSHPALGLWAWKEVFND